MATAVTQLLGAPISNRSHKNLTMSLNIRSFQTKLKQSINLAYIHADQLSRLLPFAYSETACDNLHQNIVSSESMFRVQ